MIIHQTPLTGDAMLPRLSETEVRLMGCLMEKSITTPDQMPLTLSALTQAANQKSARDPVMSLTRAEVQRAARDLASRSLLHIDENFRSGVEKYRQRLFGAGQFADIKLTRPQFALLTLLLLRGAQTPGELRTRAKRLHEFADNAAAAEQARALCDPDNSDNALLVQLPRLKGRREAQFMHQLGGVINLDEYAALAAPPERLSADQARIAELEKRIQELEAENAMLYEELDQQGQSS